MTPDSNGHVVVALDEASPETGSGAARVDSARMTLQREAEILIAGRRALNADALPWITLILVAALWFAITLGVELTTRRIVAASLFTLFTHIPTWPILKRRR